METNLEQIKNIAISFLYLRPERDKIISFIVHHPFFDSDMIYNIKTKELISIDDTGKYNKLLDDYKDIIMQKTSVFKIFMMISKPYRLTFLKYIKNYLSKEDFSKILLDVWILTEFPSSDVNVALKEILNWFKHADKSHMIDEEDVKTYNNFPEQIAIYRGIKDSSIDKGISYTTDIEIAKWFAQRHNADQGYLIEGIVNKKDILLYTNKRSEKEIVVDPQKIKNIKIEQI